MMALQHRQSRAKSNYRQCSMQIVCAGTIEHNNYSLEHFFLMSSARDLIDVCSLNPQAKTMYKLFNQYELHASICLDLNIS